MNGRTWTAVVLALMGSGCGQGTSPGAMTHLDVESSDRERPDSEWTPRPPGPVREGVKEVVVQHLEVLYQQGCPPQYEGEECSLQIAVVDEGEATAAPPDPESQRSTDPESTMSTPPLDPSQYDLNAYVARVDGTGWLTWKVTAEGGRRFKAQNCTVCGYGDAATAYAGTKAINCKDYQETPTSSGTYQTLGVSRCAGSQAWWDGQKSNGVTGIYSKYPSCPQTDLAYDSEDTLENYHGDYPATDTLLGMCRNSDSGDISDLACVFDEATTSQFVFSHAAFNEERYERLTVVCYDPDNNSATSDLLTGVVQFQVNQDPDKSIAKAAQAVATTQNESLCGGQPWWYRDDDGDGAGDSNQLVGCYEGTSGPFREHTSLRVSKTSADCDDNNPIQGNIEAYCDGYDNDCDGLVDEDLPLCGTRDVDNDSHNAGSADCNDLDGTIYLGAAELCDGIDNDCDGLVDDGASPILIAEVCNGRDDNCNGIIDEGVLRVAYLDMDSDKWTAADPTQALELCPDPTTGNPPAGYSWAVDLQPGVDCGDTNASVHPGADEVCDRLDNNCDGVFNEGCEDYDSDGDGVPDDIDCADLDKGVYPGVAEVCNGKDDNCDGSVDEEFIDPINQTSLCVDDDGDGWSEQQNDCDDTEPEWHPDADGYNIYAKDLDGDLSGNPRYTSSPGKRSCLVMFEYGEQVVPLNPKAPDCDDGNSLIYPGAEETCDGVDSNCDGDMDEDLSQPFYHDEDGDGYGDDASYLIACAAPDGYVTTSGDCDEHDPGVNPGATEACDWGDQNCDGDAIQGSSDITYLNPVDGDGDGFQAYQLWSIACDPSWAANPLLYIEPGEEDCDDDDETIYPGALDVPGDGKDGDCDGQLRDNIIQVDGGWGYTQAVDSAGQLWRWGEDDGICDGGALESTPVEMDSLAHVVSSTAGSDFALALLQDGTVWSWGWGDPPQIGRDTDDYCEPGMVTGVFSAVAISAGLWHSLVLLEDGTVMAWGYDEYGEVGTGGEDSWLAKPVFSVSNVVAISAGAFHSLALLEDGTVWSWGHNSYGQLGDGTTVDRTTPVAVVGLSNVVAISAENDHSIALLKNGSVWCWGLNSYGQLGDGTTVDRTTPVAVVGLSNVAAVSAGVDHSMALLKDGTVWSWGHNPYGQLGDGTTVDHATQVAVVGLLDAVAISAGWGDSLALLKDGTVWSWGWNVSGGLGDGTSITRLAPVEVLLPE